MCCSTMWSTLKYSISKLLDWILLFPSFKSKLDIYQKITQLCCTYDYLHESSLSLPIITLTTTGKNTTLQCVL